MHHQPIDIYPTHFHAGYGLRIGRAFPFGAGFVPGGVNFSIFSRHTTGCTLVLFERGAAEPLVEIPFPAEFKIGDVFTMIVFDLDYDNLEYGFRMDGPYQPHRGHWFDRSRVLLDPYGRAIGGRDRWGVGERADGHNPFRTRLVYDDFDWLGDRPLNIPAEDLIIYELHVRGFTRHASSHTKYPGTYAALREKIPYLKALGINCIELMPIHEFDELDNTFVNPHTGRPLVNYWGYDSVGFFAPKAAYAATGPLGMQVDEFKTLVRELHRNGIEVMLDVVFNHTGEGDADGPTYCWRGIDNRSYYMLRPDGGYLDFSGCGNTLNCNNPVVRNMVIDCLRYWVAEYHIDGFRFDLASILGRDTSGQPLANPPLLESMAYDPVLANTKLIAEAWDAGGLYQVGSFPSYGRWAEWNGRYRDSVRRFLRGELGQVAELSQRIQGSPDLYGGRGSVASVNFITCHDGFTLHDLFAYNEKHNLANGEGNRDGANDNYSWNCGAEGPTDDPAVLALRARMMRNAVLILMVSQGIPLFLMGDEVGHTKFGNNNTYCHDNELNWFNWELVEQHSGLWRFFQRAIAFNRAHPVFRYRLYPQMDGDRGGYPPLSWHGVKAWQPDWSYHCRTLAFMLVEPEPKRDSFVYVALNMHWDAHDFELPRLPGGWRWHLAADTARPSPADFADPDCEPLLADQRAVTVGARSAVIALGKRQT